MNLKCKYLSAALAALLLAASLSACQDKKDPAETGTGQANGTTAETEAQTAIPRYDYMKADVAADVAIDRDAYTNLVLTVPNSLKVEDEDVQDYIADIRFQYRTAVNGTTMVKDQPLVLGDDAYIYYKGFLNGEAFEGGSNWDDPSPYKLGLGSGSFIPGFEESLVGVIPNTTTKDTPAEINVTFPEDYGSADLAGKAVVFKVVVEYAVQYTLPDYNREFVEKTLKYEPKKEFYASETAFLEEFEDYVFDYLTAQAKSGLQNAQSAALWEHLADAAVCQNLPAPEVAYYLNAYKSDLEYYYESYKAYGGEQFATQYPDLGSFAQVYLGLDAGTNWEAALADMADELVCRDMITHAIAEREGLETVSEEEYKAQVKYWVDYYASRYGNMTEEEVIANLGEAFLKESALSEKMEKWLLEQVTFTYEDGTPIVSTTDNEA